jgi:hypothetical protein
MPAVLRHNLRANDGRFERLIGILSPGSNKQPEMLPDLFDKLNNQLQVAEKSRQVIGSLEAAIALENEMILLGRADNSLAYVEKKDIRKILRSSWISNLFE